MGSKAKSINLDIEILREKTMELEVKDALKPNLVEYNNRKTNKRSVTQKS